MTIAIIRVYHDQPPTLISHDIQPVNYLVSTKGVASFAIHSAAGIETIENYRGPYQIEVRALADELRKLFSAEPEDEYVLRHDNDEVVPCGNCRYPAPTWRSPEGGGGAREKLRCKVCNDTPRSGWVPEMCYQTNVFLAAIEKGRPVEGELATLIATCTDLIEFLEYGDNFDISDPVNSIGNMYGSALEPIYRTLKAVVSKHSS